MLFRFVKYWWHLNICSVWNMVCNFQKHLKYWKQFMCVMLLSTLTAFSKSKRIGSFGPKRTCILQSVLGCLTQQTWETKETDRHHQVGDILSKRCHQRTKTKFPKRSVQQRGKGKMQQRKIKDATQELQHKMQQEIPKIQELQHKMQNPAAAVRNKPPSPG